MKYSAKYNIVAVLLATLLLSSCKEESPVEPSGSITEIPVGAYLINEVGGQTIISSPSPFGGQIGIDTIPSSDLFEPNKSIFEISKDSLFLYVNIDTATTRSPFEKNENFMTGAIDTAAIREAAKLAGSEIEIQEYSMSKPFFTLSGSTLVMNSTHSVSVKVTTESNGLLIPLFYTIAGDVMFKGNALTGKIPPASWPQNVLPTQGANAVALIDYSR